MHTLDLGFANWVFLNTMKQTVHVNSSSLLSSAISSNFKSDFLTFLFSYHWLFCLVSTISELLYMPSIVDRIEELGLSNSISCRTYFQCATICKMWNQSWVKVERTSSTHILSVHADTTVSLRRGPYTHQMTVGIHPEKASTDIPSCYLLKLVCENSCTRRNKLINSYIILIRISPT